MQQNRMDKKTTTKSVKKIWGGYDKIVEQSEKSDFYKTSILPAGWPSVENLVVPGTHIWGLKWV